ncbi:hypothetical protein [Variovorax sp. OV329]|uniref:hypothetical protein n=1 Tax=Variovorax sp. OV329 TaxID=1882825 RepID=UPI0008E5DE2B|nr:hypothetical protein [Variovorax sp. OV329]SFN17790.1 hypothetical protein SAMN05444747_11712 [Variovorax sp. OV329]
MDRLADRMRSRIARTFVGREPELALFSDSLAEDPPAVPIFFIHGPGGIGKTCLLERARALAAAHGIDSVRIDARDIEASLHGLTRALADALGDPAQGVDLPSVLAHCARMPRRLLVIDSYEHLEYLDGWLRENFLAQLPGAMRVLIAGRGAPDAAWRTHPMWREAARVLGLRNLDTGECACYLAARGIDATEVQAIAQVTHGHPLALTLVADVVASSGEVPQQLGLDVVRQLAERFTAQSPTELHRRALEVCAHARVTTEALLTDTVDAGQAHELFDWLASLSVIESGPAGLFPHDLVREAIDDELQWRHPERHREIHVAIRDHLIRRARDAVHGAQRSFDILFLHRHAQAMRPFVDFRALGSVYFERGAAGDLPLMLASLQGEVPAPQHEAISRWWSHPACTAWVVRPAAGQLVAATLSIDLAALSDEERESDPMMAAVWRGLQQMAPPHPGGRQLLARWNFASGGTQQPSAAMNGLQMSQFHQWLTVPRLGAFVICTDHPEHWSPMMRHIDFERMPSCNRTIDGVPMGCYLHDWHAVPIERWLDVMVDRELGEERPMADPFASPAAARLARHAFDRAVREALRVLDNRSALASSPLTASTLVNAASDGSRPPGETLQQLLVEAVEALGRRPRDAKFSRALELTFVRPAGSQELAAERLGVPFGTYRYQLATGIDRLVAALWERETG